MKKCLFTYHAPVGALQQMANATPEEQAKGMDMWPAWAQRCGDKLLDMGAPLAYGQRLISGWSPDATIEIHGTMPMFA